MHDDRLSRRHLLRQLSIGIPLLPLAAAFKLNTALAADTAVATPFVSPDSKEAKAVKYVEDASKAQGAQPGSTCASCALYEGRYGSTAGPCQIFSGKQVKAAGWCSSWAPQM